MPKIEILYGIHPVREALRALRREFIEVYLSKETDSERLDKIAGNADRLNIPVKWIDSEKLKAVTGTDMHQGVGAKVGPYPYAELFSVLESGNESKKPFLMLLDHLIDPQNLGAIIRTALCIGVNAVIIPKDRSAGPTPAVSRVSAGALEHIRLCRVTNMVNTIKMLKESGIWVLGLDRSAKSSIYSIDLTDGVGIVIGGEDRGIRQLVKQHCDDLISIPQTSVFNSLNASVAGAVVMYEAFRQRTMPERSMIEIQ